MLTDLKALSSKFIDLIVNKPIHVAYHCVHLNEHNNNIGLLLDIVIGIKERKWFKVTDNINVLDNSDLMSNEIGKILVFASE